MTSIGLPYKQNKNNKPKEIVMPKEKVLGCTCGDCLHWEIIDKGESVVGTTPVAINLKCKTCGQKFQAMFCIDPHEKLTEVEIDA